MDSQTKWFPYILTIFIATVLVSLMAMFFTTMTILSGRIYLYYLFMIIGCVILGFFSGSILNKISGTNKRFLWAGMIITIISTSIISFFVRTLQILDNQMITLTANMVQSGTPVNAFGSTLSFFGALPNTIIVTILIFVSFNGLHLTNFLEDKERNNKDLYIYLYGAIIIIILYFGMQYFLNSALGTSLT